MANYKKVKKCRLCESRKLKQIINFGLVPLGNNLLYKKEKSILAEKFPLCLLKCFNCSHFQLSAMVDPKLLYATNYSYLTGVAPSFINHFKEYAKWIEKKCNLEKNSKILDIGSNDGTCLKAFKKNKHTVLGVDPAKLPAKIANKNGINTINKFFDINVKNIIEKKYGKFDFITSHNVLAHIEDILEVFKGIYELLNDKGYFCFEVGYFIKVIKNNYFDTIYHEHLDYHHAKPLVAFLKKIGFSVLFISQNKIQGGSIRILCRKQRNIKISKQVNNFLFNENKLMVNYSKKIMFWEKKINENLNHLKRYIKQKKMHGSIIAGYGAPTKATLLIKILNINNDVIDYIVEDNSLKVKRYLPNTGIKVESNNKLKKFPPDIMIIFAWNFVSDIIKKLKKENIGDMEILIPLPTFKKIRL